jgi:hypothetical protein
LLSPDFLIEHILALFGRIGILDLFDSLSDFMADQIRIFKQPDDLFPDDFVQVILTDRLVLT